MNFTADNFTLDNFCHALHQEERETERLEAMKPLPRGDFNPTGYAGGQRQEQRDTFKTREHYQARNRDRMVTP